MTNVPGLIDEVKSVEPERFKSSQRKIEASRCPPITSAGFRGRATRYRLAAAIADSHLEAQRFRDLAMMFEKIADDLRKSANDVFSFLEIEPGYASTKCRSWWVRDREQWCHR